jgi:hypothetical protein
MNICRAIPNPKVNVSNPRTVTGPTAGTVSFSGPSIRRMTRRFASSGSSRFTGSSSSNSPSRTKASVAAAVIGFVVDAIRNREPRSTGLPPIAERPDRLDVHLVALCHERDQSWHFVIADVRGRDRSRTDLARPCSVPCPLQPSYCRRQPKDASECGRLIGPARDSSDSTLSNVAPSR